MGPIDAFWHLLNFGAVAALAAGLAAAFAKLLWRSALASRPWLRLAAAAFGAALVVQVAGLLLLERDGRMATYLTMVPAMAAALWWAGFRPGSSR